jgi:succinate-semialdehyde dehydrogenase/glutarate-semialdehyde dehydrogenase
MAARKIAAAIAAGCTCVVKPAEQTPLSTLALASTLGDAGLPPGGVNVLTTSCPQETVATMIGDPRTRKVSFTGSTQVGQALISQASKQVLRMSMELGGNAPFLVFADANLDDALDGAVHAKMRNAGQACTAANRFLVAESIAVEFGHRFAERIESLRVGPGTDPDAEVGPLIDGSQRARVAALVDDAVARGADLLTGGRPLDGAGYFYAPTVLGSVPHDARLLEQEIFGPVAPILTFTDEEMAIRLANDTHYGLAAYVYTRDVDRALRVAEQLETGMVGLNQASISNAAAPFGGIKSSGFGREGGPEGLAEYLETKYIALPT